MSNFNYMDNVPVKISESYKPLPKVFQIPQAIAHKLQLPAQHYQESPQYAYDFQLEKKVLAKIPEWRRMRQQERENRRERKQKREDQRMRALEQQHKQMLGAVSYPDAEEFSTESDTDDEVCESELTADGAVIPEKVTPNGPRLAINEAGSFHNILQPTILPQSSGSGKTGSTKVHNSTNHTRNKSSSSFNYKDFEDDTSSPFDNIELKTINDLDILAQVLQNTQVRSKGDSEQQGFIESAEQPLTEKESKEISDVIEVMNTTSIDTIATLENAKAALERVDFNITNEQLQTIVKNIPNNVLENDQSNTPASNNLLYSTQHHSQHSGQNFSAYVNQQQPSYFLNYNNQQSQQQQQFNSNFNQIQQPYATNQNYLYSTPTCNGGSYYSPSHVSATQYVGNNANTYLASTFANPAAYGNPQLLPVTNIAPETDLKSKSKSVPDILKELTDEVRNSEMRRSRNYSYNTQDEEEEVKEDVSHEFRKVESECVTAPKKSSMKSQVHIQQSTCYSKLESSTQELARNISSMGFPLERVAKIAQMFGADDKKIVEHLIPLSELIDLGFDESKISEALLRFDNNKEKALEYLIS